MISKINAEVFLTVAELKNYRKAADELGYTQAGISYIINSMEEEAGFRFFAREYGGVRLTPEGEKMLPSMQRLREAEQIVNEQADRIKGLETGHIRLISFNTVIVCWLPDIIEGFHKQYPGIEIELSACDVPQDAVRMILNREADCGFLSLDQTDEIDLFKLKEEPEVAVVSESHPMAKEKIFPVRKMGDFPFIGASREELQPVYDLAEQNGVQLNQVMTVTTDYGCFSMISKNLGYGVYPKMIVEKCGFPVKAIPLDHPTVTTISIGVGSYENCSLATKAFVDYVREQQL